MITSKEKAEELIIKYKQIIKAEWDTECGGYDLHGYEQDAKQCALIAVNEIIELYEFHAISDPDNKRVIDTLNYFDEVKQEIEKL